MTQRVETDMLRMSNVEYTATQDAILLAASVVQQLDIDAFLDRIRYTNTLAPMINPSVYRAGQKTLAAVEDLARAAKAFKDAALRFADEVKL